VSIRIGWGLAIFLAIAGDWIANEKPLYCLYEEKHYFPILEAPLVEMGLKTWPAAFNRGNWREIPLQDAVQTLIPYSPGTIDRRNLGLRSPMQTWTSQSTRERHWLGTDRLGRDVLAGWIRGFRMALGIGVLSMLLAAGVGIFFGGFAGFYSNDRLRLSALKALVLAIWLAGACWWGWAALVTRGSSGPVFTWLLSWMVAGLLWWWIPFPGRRIAIPADSLLTWVIQAVDAIPALFFVFAFLPLFEKPGFAHVILLIALIRWTGIARLARAEFFRIRDLEYIQAARLLGVGPWRLAWSHILPNAMGSLWITLAYGMAASVLLEAYLGFLGVGLPSETVSWGSQMQQVRDSPSAWWLAVFPGLALFWMLYSLRKAGEKWQFNT